MHFPPFDWNPPRRQLRQFAWGTALFLAVLSWAGGPPLALRLTAAFLFALGTVLPGVLRWPYVALLYVLYLMGRLFHRVSRTFSTYPARKQNTSRQAKPLPEQHDRSSATGTHG
ncbi:MAG TPA: hypothetical protein VKU02_21855 [Gemmataceae bacterium]|nr:hypothetical protein [Gemmataceae bacterium]